MFLSITKNKTQPLVTWVKQELAVLSFETEDMVANSILVLVAYQQQLEFLFHYVNASFSCDCIVWIGVIHFAKEAFGFALDWTLGAERYWKAHHMIRTCISLRSGLSDVWAMNTVKGFPRCNLAIPIRNFLCCRLRNYGVIEVTSGKKIQTKK